MNPRIRQLERLGNLRAAKERISEVAFLRSQQSVREAEAAISALAASRKQAMLAGREGLLNGEWEHWWLSESADALAERAERELLALRQERSQIASEKQQALNMASRETERARLLLDQSKEAERIVVERQSQNTSDDAFAARGHWLRGETARRSMNMP